MAAQPKDRLSVPLGPIKRTSFSALEKYEKCPFMARLKYVDRIPEPNVPRPAMDRGNAVHKDAEDFVMQESDTNMKPLAKELRNFTAEMWKLREWWPLGAVLIEDEWGFKRDWTPCEWNDPEVWLRVKLDVLVFMEGDHYVIIDHKTGKVYQIKHNDQGMVYAIATWLKYPGVRKVSVEFWYHDQDDMSCVSYTPQQIIDRWAAIEKRFDAMTTATKFPARPSIDNCRYCPYRKEDQLDQNGYGGTGHCPHSVAADPFQYAKKRTKK